VSDSAKLPIVAKPSSFARAAIAASFTAHCIAGLNLAACNDVVPALVIKRLPMAALVIVTVSAFTVSGYVPGHFALQ